MTILKYSPIQPVHRKKLNLQWTFYVVNYAMQNYQKYKICFIFLYIEWIRKYTWCALRKNVWIQSFFWSVFSRILIEYGDLQRKSLYSVKISDDKEKKDSRFGHFPSSDSPYIFAFIRFIRKYWPNPISLRFESRWI